MIKINTKYSPLKKVLAVMLAFVLVFSMAIPGFAADGGGFEGDSGVYIDEVADPRVMRQCRGGILPPVPFRGPSTHAERISFAIFSRF